MLINNGIRYGGGPMRFEGGANAYPSNVQTQPAQTPAGYFNFNHGEATAGSVASAFGNPSGARHPAAWNMGEVGGAIKSYKRTDIAVDAASSGELGYPATGSVSFTIDGSAVGGLIVGATGTATISIDGTAAILAVLNATGSATISIDGSAVLGAIASLTGQATLTIDGSSTIMALGYMTGTTVETGELTPAGIALAVWEYLISGTQAQDLLAASGAAGDPLLGIVEGTLTLKDVQRITLAALAGTSEKTGSTIVFKGLDGTTDRIIGSFDAENNRTGAILNGV